MRKTMMIAAFAVAMAASPLAFAQNTMAPATNAATASNGTDVRMNRIEPGQIRATNLRGIDIYDGQNSKVGSVRDIVLDRSGRVAAVVLDVDGRNIGVPMRDLHIAMKDNGDIGKVTIDRSRDQLKSAEAFDLNNTSTATGSGSSVAPATIPADRSR